jgi:transcriptional regulator with XRE-family HTH domain
MGKRRTRLSDQIRKAVDASGLSRYRIAKEIGIVESAISKFMAGKGGLSLEKLDALAELLGLSLTKSRATRKRG